MAATLHIEPVQPELLGAFHKGGDLRRVAPDPLREQLQELREGGGSSSAADAWFVKNCLLNQDFEAVSAYLQLDGEVPIEMLQKKRVLLQLMPLLEGPGRSRGKIAKLLNAAATQLADGIIVDMLKHGKRLDEWLKVMDNTDDRKKTKHSMFGVKGKMAKGKS